VSKPNQPDDDFEAQLRLALGEHADAAQHVNLADSALSRARGIRRRRVALSTVAVLATVAIAIPVGAQLAGDGDTDHTASDTTTDVGPEIEPKPVNVALADLPGGDTPQVPYIAGATFVDASGTAHDAEADPGMIVTDAATLADGTLLWERDKNDATKMTLKVSDGGSSGLPLGESVTPPAIDESGTAAAFAVHGSDASGNPSSTDTIVYAKAVDGGDDTVDTIDTGMKVRQIMGAYNGRVVFNAKQRGEGEVVGVVVMGSDDSVSTPWADLKTVTAVSPTESLLAGLPARGGRYAPGQRRCSQLVDAASGDSLWANCDWNPVEFSPDGTLVLAIPAYGDGFGPTSLAVLDTTTGTVVQEYRTRGTFGRATFDGSSDAVIAVVLQGTQSSIVRCSIDSPDCELTTVPVTVTPFDPVSLTQPYQLTAN
jgi:hypothetical protein